MEIVFFFMAFLMSLVGLQLSLWLIFEHNDLSGWKSLIPFYNLIQLQKISRYEPSTTWMWFVPFLNIWHFYNVNQSLCDFYNVNKQLSWGMTIAPWAFYPLFAVHVVDWMDKSIYRSFCGPLPLFGPANYKVSTKKKAA